jgi:hypothetical protein
MDLLMNCQRNFVYVNYLFSVGNISPQFPTEAKDFAAVKGKWTTMEKKQKMLRCCKVQKNFPLFPFIQRDLN